MSQGIPNLCETYAAPQIDIAKPWPMGFDTQKLENTVKFTECTIEFTTIRNFRKKIYKQTLIIT